MKNLWKSYLERENQRALFVVLSFLFLIQLPLLVSAESILDILSFYFYVLIFIATRFLQKTDLPSALALGGWLFISGSLNFFGL